MKRSKKTDLFNSIRKVYAGPVAERWLVPMVKNKRPDELISKLLPMPYLYPSPSWRTSTRDGLTVELDISDFVDWMVYFGLKDHALDFLLSLVESDSVVADIGSNIGYVALRMAQRAPHGFVFGFEASDYNYRKAQTNLSMNALPNVEVERVAVGEANKRIVMISGDRNNHGMTKVSSGTDHQNEGVEMVTFDSWIDAKRLKKLDLIKLDVEGYELRVLSGAARTIDRFRPMLFMEVDDSLLSNFQGSSREIFDWLSDRQYRVFDLIGRPIEAPPALANKHLDIVAVPAERKNTTFSRNRMHRE